MKYYRKYHGESCYQDWHRVLGLYQASLNSPSFKASKPLAFNLDKGTIDYEPFPKGEVLAYCLFKALITRRKSNISKINNIFFTIGQALAQFHQNFKLSDNDSFEIKLPKEIYFDECKLNYIKTKLNNSKFAHCHGDFGTGNIWIPDCGKFSFLFDPIPSTFFPDQTANKTSIYYDIGHMISTLWFVYPLWIYPLIDWKIPKILISSFLHGYEKESNQPLDKVVVFYMAIWMIDAYIRKNKKTFTGVRGSMRNYLYLKRRASLVEIINNG